MCNAKVMDCGVTQMPTAPCIAVKCFSAVKRVSVYLVAWIGTGLGGLSYLCSPETIPIFVPSLNK